MTLAKTNFQPFSFEFLEAVGELLKNSEEAERLKWELLRQNPEYQNDYDNFEMKIKTMSHEDDVHYYEKKFTSKYGIAYFKNYRCEIKPYEELFGYFLEGLILLPETDEKKEYFSDHDKFLFNFNKRMFYPVGPYSLNDLREPCLISPIQDFAINTEGFFSYLDANERNLMTITFDISKVYTEHEFELFSLLIKRQLKINYEIKKLELVKNEERISSYIDVIKLSNANVKLEEIYNVLLNKKLVQKHDGDDLDNKSRKRALASQKIIYAKDFINKLNPLVKIQIPNVKQKNVRKKDH